MLRKVAYGIYIDNNLIEDEFYILQKRFSNIVFSYNTACYLINLSDRAPYKMDVTTINHNNINENLNIYYVSKNKFKIGITEIGSPYSNSIKIYNAERCICDLASKFGLTQLELYQRFMLERISISKYSSNFILKGGLLLSTMLEIESGSTRDMDVSIKGIDVVKEKMLEVLNEILSIDINHIVNLLIGFLNDNLKEEIKYSTY